jgi:single-strand DNA-binding protein
VPVRSDSYRPRSSAGQMTPVICACGHRAERHAERKGERSFCCACSCLHLRRPKGDTTLANANTTSIGMPTAKIGTLSTDPELRSSAAGKPYLRVRLAVKPFVSGADQETETLFYDVVAFGSLAEHAAKSLHKGDRVVVIGTGKRNTWTGRDGHERTTNEIVANGLGPDLRFASIALEQLPEQATAELGIT